MTRADVCELVVNTYCDVFDEINKDVKKITRTDDWVILSHHEVCGNRGMLVGRVLGKVKDGKLYLVCEINSSEYNGKEIKLIYCSPRKKMWYNKKLLAPLQYSEQATPLESVKEIVKTLKNIPRITQHLMIADREVITQGDF